MSQLVALENESTNDEVLQWVTFQLEDETYGVNVMQVREVLRYSEIACSWCSELCSGDHQLAR